MSFSCLPLSPAQVLAELQTLGAGVASVSAKLQSGSAESLWSTDKETVLSEDRVSLYRFKSRSKKRLTLLIVYALVNRPYMLDLQPDRSLIRGLLKAGVDVYLIDWGYPEPEDAELGLDAYIRGYLDRCVDHIRNAQGLERVDLLGVCQGGTFSLCYAALFPDRIGNLVTMVTPVDFHAEQFLLSQWLRHIDIAALTETLDLVPGDFLTWLFSAMKPMHFSGRKYLDLLDHLDDSARVENFRRMERWIQDSPDQAGRAFREFAEDFFQGNKLLAGGLRIGGNRVDLGAIRCPVLNIYATRDHLVPPAASTALNGLTGSNDYRELAFDSGHIGIYVSTAAQTRVPGAIARWLKKRQPTT